jgi:uncharacterized membrane protein
MGNPSVRVGWPLWLIPLPYLFLGIAAGFALPRIEHAYLPTFGHVVSVGSAQAYLSAVASGTITLTALAFSVMFLMMQMTMSAYSKRLIMLFAGNPLGLHALGVFSATFMCALGTLQFVDRNHNGEVPLLSMEFVIALLVTSMVLLALLVQRVALIRITYVLQFIGDKGRAVIAKMLPRLEDDTAEELVTFRRTADALRAQVPMQAVTYDGVPLAIANFRINDFVRQAKECGGTIIMKCAVGDTVSQGTVLLEVYGAKVSIPEPSLLQGIVLARERTFEQDPKYPLRLLVDTAIMALSPAVNDPTTAVQAIDQIQDLLHRLGDRVLEAGFVKDAQGDLRLIFPMPTWGEYLSLAFDEIRLYGADTVQVLRRMRAALMDLAGSLSDPTRVGAVREYLEHLNAMVERSGLDAYDKALAIQADPQGLGHTRPPAAIT